MPFPHLGHRTSITSRSCPPVRPRPLLLPIGDILCRPRPDGLWEVSRRSSCSTTSLSMQCQNRARLYSSDSPLLDSSTLSADELAKDKPDLSTATNDAGVLLVGPRTVMRARTSLAIYDLRDVMKKLAAKTKKTKTKPRATRATAAAPPRRTSDRRTHRAVPRSATG